MAITSEQIIDIFSDFCRRIAQLEADIPPNVYQILVTGGDAEDNVTSGPHVVSNNETLHIWSAGTIGVNVTDGSARVQLTAKSVSEDPVNSGPPADPPSDPSSPFIHFAFNGLYYWSPTSDAWIFAPAAGGAVDVIPSIDGCNGLILGSDNHLFTEDFGYRAATTFAELETLINNGEDALVCSQLTMTADSTLGLFTSNSNVKFVLNGSIDTDGFTLVINCGIENPRNKQIFFNYVLDETYPNRILGLGSTVRGLFGGNNERDPRWWGLKSSENEAGSRNELLSVAQLNNNAIAAAALSSSSSTAGGDPSRQLTVKMPFGDFAVHRTIRLDSLRVHLVGPEEESLNACRISAHNENYFFDVTHFIITEDYPIEGSTPVVQIGWEIQSPEIGGDAGFGSGVKNISINCPNLSRLPARRVSGIMWHSGLQEGSCVRYVGVKGHSGYAIGGPRRQQLFLNDPNPGSYYMQLNTVEFNNINIHNPMSPGAIGMSVFGLNFSASVITVIHHGDPSGPAFIGGLTTPAIITDSRSAGSWKNIHIEISPAEGVIGIGILIPADGPSNSKMNLESIGLLHSNPQFGTLREYATVMISRIQGGVSCRAISCQAPWQDTVSVPGVTYKGRAIIDTVTLKESSGNFSNLFDTSYVASYDRQSTNGVIQVASSDPAMLLSGSVTYDPPSLADGDGVTTTIPVTGSVIGDYVDVSFGVSTQGVDLSGWVAPDGTVNVRFQNETGGVVDLASSTLRATIRGKA